MYFTPLEGDFIILGMTDRRTIVEGIGIPDISISGNPSPFGMKLANFASLSTIPLNIGRVGKAFVVIMLENHMTVSLRFENPTLKLWQDYDVYAVLLIVNVDGRSKSTDLICPIEIVPLDKGFHSDLPIICRVIVREGAMIGRASRDSLNHDAIVGGGLLALSHDTHLSKELEATVD
jgi:hypothetical protein